jgi:2-oxoglutarate ferredoxin oxidoreductase subunit delta
MPIKGWVEIDEEYCKACELCVNACPQEVLDLAQDRLNPTGYHPVELVGDSCTGCAVCALVCPEAAITVFREPSRTKEREAV